MHLRARWYHKSRSALLCLSFFCVTLLREALVYYLHSFKVQLINLLHLLRLRLPMNLSKLHKALITVAKLPRQGMFGNHTQLSRLTACQAD